MKVSFLNITTTTYFTVQYMICNSLCAYFHIKKHVALFMQIVCDGLYLEHILYGHNIICCINQALEHRTKESRHEMDVLDALEELKDLNARNAHGEQQGHLPYMVLVTLISPHPNLPFLFQLIY